MFIPDQSLFEQSVDAMLPSVHIGLSYTTPEGHHYNVTPHRIELTEVGYRDWPEFLRFFREPLGTMPRQNPARYMGTLRIFEYDLGELPDADHVVASIKTLSLRSKALGRLEDRFCFWQPPYPCYVERIGFDASTFATDGNSWLFQIVPFTFRSAIVTSGWVQAEKVKDLPVYSWLLPGHGAALMWKPSSSDHITF
ncbi:MAG: hypothetical protein ACRDRV_16500 [Pseudonocardiaceae bacterium]